MTKACNTGKTKSSVSNTAIGEFGRRLEYKDEGHDEISRIRNPLGYPKDPEAPDFVKPGIFNCILSCSCNR